MAQHTVLNARTLLLRSYRFNGVVAGGLQFVYINFRNPETLQFFDLLERNSGLHF